VKSHRIAVANHDVILKLARADKFIATVASLTPTGGGEWVVCWVTRNRQDPSDDFGAHDSLEILNHPIPEVTIGSPAPVAKS
jgi:hypothetical protein